MVHRYRINQKKAILSVLCLVLTLFVTRVSAQDASQDPKEKSKIQRLVDNFDVSIYMDVYFTSVLDKPDGDTSNLLQFASNSPFINEFRLNVASIWLEYADKNIRGKLLLQYGDIPNLRANPDEQFVKYMKKAYFGFRLFKDIWVDLGYISNPIGYESSYPILNQISTVTVGGYFETGNFLGVMVSGKLAKKLTGGFYVGNPYTLAFGKNKNIYGGITVTYNPFSWGSITYNNMLGYSSIATSELHHFYLYNNLILTAQPTKNLLLVGQCDFGMLTKSGRPPDTTSTARGISGFLQATYTFTKWFGVSVRGEYFNDPDAGVSSLYAYDGKLRGLLTYGGTVSVEFKPVKYSYIRAEYSYLSADKDNDVFNSNLSDYRQVITLTAGLRFGVF